MEKLYIASDHGGFRLKNEIKEHLKLQDIEAEDLGCYTSESCDYPDFAHKLCYKVLEEKAKGILICGTGIGMSIAANKVKGAYAACIHDVYQAQRAELSNHANIITMGSQVIGVQLAKELIKEYLSCTFDPNGRSRDKVQRIIDFEGE